MPNVLAGVPKENPPPAAALFAGVPKLKAPVVFALVWVAVPKVNPPPPPPPPAAAAAAAGVEPVSPKPVAAAGVGAADF